MNIFTKEHLQAIAPPVELPKTNGTAIPKAANGPKRLLSFNMPAFLATHAISTRDPEPYQGGQKWLLDECPFCHNSDHCACVYVLADGSFGFSCSHNSCKSKYHWHDFREHFEPGAYAPPDRETEPGKEKEESQALKLVSLALQHCELFSTPKGEFYARVTIDNHVETMIIGERGGAFKRWLINGYLQETGSIPNATALSSAIGALEAKAQWGGGKRREVNIRLAYHDGIMYLDLADKDYSIVKVTKDGWTIVHDAPVCFRRADGMLPLPMPVHGGNLDELRTFINVTDENDWLLVKAWLLGTLHPTGPYPILDFSGERGSAKTSAAKRLRMMIDPHMAPLRKEPKDDQTFTIMAHNNYVVALDNLSHISTRLSDLMCTLSTGAGDAYRKHYSNDDEVIFSARRPQVFTGIEELATRGDLIDRCIIIKLPIIEENKRCDERALDKAFEEAHPRLLGALLDAVSLALRNLPNTHIDKLPRMADFALWIQAAEENLTTQPGTFLAAYKYNREEGIATEIEASAVGQALLKFMTDADRWESTVSDLLAKLKTHVDEEATKQRSWPKNARALSGSLKRLAPSLRAKGLHIIQKRTNEGSFITITKQAAGDANDPKSDANDPKSDANFASVTQKNSDLRHPQTEDTPDFTPIVTQSDANIPTFSFPDGKEKEEEKSEETIDRNTPENLRHFASLFENPSSSPVKGVDDRISDIVAKLTPGKLVTGPDGVAFVRRVSKFSVDLEHFGRLKTYTGIAILGIIP